ncbi:MAG: PKD domain-containing protein [Bacteroidota bacterium]
MKSVFAFSAIVLLLDLLPFRTMAQVGCPFVTAGPDAAVNCSTTCVNLNALFFNTGQTSTYTVQTIAYSPNSFTAGTPILVNIDDTWSSSIALPFDFCFFGVNYNRVVIGSNGIISFNLSNAGGFCPWDLTMSTGIPDGNLPTNSIMGIYQDIDPTNLGDIYYSLSGTAPCRKLIVSFTNIPYYGDPNSISTGFCGSPLFSTSQIVLYETTNAIDIYIQNKPYCTGWNNGLAIGGIQNANGSLAFTIPGGNNAVWNASNRAYRFLPSGPSIVSFQWMQGNTVISTNLTTQVCPATTTTYTAQATYSACNGTQIVVTDNVTVSSSNALQSTASVTQQVSCFNGNDGAASASVQTGQPPYSYLWSNGTTTANVSNLSPGNYTVTVTDAGGCTNQLNVNITNPPQLLPGAPVIQQPSCSSPASGSISISPSGGTAPYTYAWIPGVSSGSTASNLSAGNFSCVVTDANGCSASVSVTLNVPTPLNSSASSTSVSCFGGSDATATGTATAGTAPYSYSWNTLPPQTNSTATGLSAGTYICTVTDNAGCTSSSSVTVNQPTAVSLTGNTTQPTCLGVQTGSISVSPAGGTTPYTYSWQPSVGTSAQISGLAAGNYSCTITDSRGCTASASFNINALPVLTVNTNSTSTSCFGCSDGSVTASLSGGLAPVTYLWSPGNLNGSTVNQVVAGVYSVVATDANGCTGTSSVSVTQPSPFTFSLISSALGICDGESVVLTAVGANSVTWPDGSNGSTLTASPTQTTNYTVIGADASGCSDTQSVSVNVHPLPIATAQATKACEGQPLSFTDNSSISSGGIVSYAWSFGDGTTSALSNPIHTYGSVGVYQVAILVGSDQGCLDSTTVTATVYELPEPLFTADRLAGCPPLTVNFQDNSLVGSGTLQSWYWSVSNGTSYAAQNPTMVFGSPGRYDVSLTTVSTTGCSDDTIYGQYIEVYSEPVADFRPNPERLSEFNAGVTLIDQSAGAVSWRWSFGDSTTSNLQSPNHTYATAGTYTIELIVTSSNGCVDTITKVIIVDNETTVYIPSAFSPNGDEKNELFSIQGIGFSDFKMDIFDRWGLLIYSTDRAENGWDGKYKNRECQADVYVYRIRFRDIHETPFDYSGKVTLVR